MGLEELNQELQYLDETKQQIKQAIIDKGQTIQDTDSFRSYVEKIDNIESASFYSTDDNIVEVPIYTYQVPTAIFDIPKSNFPNAVVGDYLRFAITITAGFREVYYVITKVNAETLEGNLTVEVLVSDIDTRDANATDLDIKVGKTAYVNGQKINGNVPDLVAGGNFGVEYVGINGWYDNRTKLGLVSSFGGTRFVEDGVNLHTHIPVSDLQSAGDIYPEKIVNGETIFGVVGTASTGLDTSDATATADDIAQDKIAYVKGQRIVGTVHVHQDGYVYKYVNDDGVTAELMDISGSGEYTGVAINYENTGAYKEMFNPGAHLTLVIRYTDLSNLIGLNSSKLALGSEVLGIEGGYIGSTDGIVAYDTEEALMGDTTQKINTLGVIPTYIGGVWDGNRLINSKTFLLPKNITLHTVPTESLEVPMYYLNDEGTDSGMGPMTFIRVNLPGTWDETRYTITEGDTMYGAPKIWYSEDGINFVGQDDILGSGTSGWTVSRLSAELPETTMAYMQDIIHTLEFGTPRMYLWNGTDWGITAPTVEEATNLSEDILGV